MKKQLLIAALLTAILMTCPVLAREAGSQSHDDNSVTVVRHYQKAFRYQYHLDLLELVLTVTREEFGPSRLQPVPAEGPEVSEARGLRLLKNGKIDVVFLSTSREREREYLPVRVPLLKGLLGFRLLLIDEGQRSKFDDVPDLATLTRGFTAGFNPHWVDYGIYRANGFNLVDSVKYEDLFAMLEAGRFDFIPRGVNEVWEELDYFRERHPALSVEQSLALFYPYPVYFFVEKNNHRLHQRLKTGLRIIREDGRFHELLRQHYQGAVNRAKLDERRLLKLDNPLLPDNAPAANMEWWLQQNSLLPESDLR